MTLTNLAVQGNRSEHLAQASSYDTAGVVLSLSARHLLRIQRAHVYVAALLVVATFLSDLGIAGGAAPMLRQLDLKLEGNVAVWYSSLVLMLTGACALALAHRPSIATSRHTRALWIFVGLTFVAMSIDETAQLHEKTGELYFRTFGDVKGLTDGGEGVFAWLFVLLPLMLVVSTSIAYLTWTSLTAHRRERWMIGIGGLCWAGAAASEYVQAQLLRYGVDRGFEGVIEEGFEVVGATLFLFAFIDCLRSSTGQGAAS